MRNLCLLSVLVFLCLDAMTQVNQDSLELVVKNFKTYPPTSPSLRDSSVANAYFELILIYDGMGEADKAKEAALDCYNLSRQIGARIQNIRSANVLGLISLRQDNLPDAMRYALEARSLAKENVFHKAQYLACRTIASIFVETANIPEALRYSLESLTSAENTGNASLIVGAHTYIGLLLEKSANYIESLTHHFKALEISEKEYQQMIPAVQSNIANVYMMQGKYDEAIELYQKAYVSNQQVGNVEWSIINLDNIANIYSLQKDHQKSLDLTKQNLENKKAFGDPMRIADGYLGMGGEEMFLGQYDQAREHMMKGMEIVMTIPYEKQMEQFGHQMLYKLDSCTGNWNGAFGHYLRFRIIGDSLKDSERSKETLRLQMQYDFDKADALAKSEQEKKDLLSSEEISKQKLIRNGSFLGLFGVLIFLGIVFTQKKKITKEKSKSDELLLNILPAETAAELKANGFAEAKSFDQVTVMFTDFKNFTIASENMTAHELVSEINYCYSEFDKIIGKNNIEKIKTIGDGYMCAGGLPRPNNTSPQDVIRAAFEIRDFVESYKQKKISEGSIPFEIRIGIHTGPVVAGIVGIKKFAYDIWGDTVNTASRMESSGETGRINVSGSTYEIVKDDFECTYRGKVQAKNKGEIDMYFVERKQS